MKVLQLIVLFSILSTPLMSQSISSYKFGVNLNYGGSDSGALSEYSLVADVGRRLSLSARIGTNYSTKFRVGAGLSYSYISRKKFRGSIGLEYHHNEESIVWQQRAVSFYSVHLPILFDFYVSNRINLNFGYVLRSTKDPYFDFDFATIGVYYRIK